MICVYCGQESAETREHVVPKFMGTFSPISPIIRCVCGNCNSKVFSALETEFIEDSFEGIRIQMLNLSGSMSARIRGNTVQMKSDTGEEFFNEMFPFFKLENGKLLVDLKPQIKIKNYAGDNGYQVFQIDGPKEILKNAESQKALFERTKTRLKVAEKENNIFIFVGSQDGEDRTNLDQAIELLNAFGVNYKEKESKGMKLPEGSSDLYKLDIYNSVSENAARIIAKIAFNYFTFCAIAEEELLLPYDPGFNDLKNFVLGDGIIKKEEIIVGISNNPIMQEEKDSGMRFLGHIIVLFEEDGFIFANVTIIGNMIYRVRLGKCPDACMHENFGCGHGFDPYSHLIHGLAQEPRENVPEEIVSAFGLYRRIV